MHEKSEPYTIPIFNLFNQPPSQNTVVKHISLEHRPNSPINTSNFVQFDVHTAFDEYIDLAKLFLHIKFKFNIHDHLKDAVYLNELKTVSYLLNSMIKQMDVLIGDTPINVSTQTYAFKAYIEALLGYTREAKESHLSSSNWLPKNSELSIHSDFEAYGRIHSDLMFQDKVLLGGCKLTIRILFHSPEFYFFTENFKPECTIKEIYLRTLRYKVPQYIVEAHDEALKISPAKYLLSSSRVKAFTIAKGLSDAYFDNIHTGQIPRRILTFFVPEKAFNGDYKYNPYKFKNFNLNSLSMNVNGEQNPPKPYTPNYTTGLQCVREFLSLFEALDMMDIESNLDTTYSTFSSEQCIYGFNLSPDLSSGPMMTGYLNPTKFGTIGLNVKFGTPLDENIKCLVYLEFDKFLEIDINRNAKIDLY